MSLPPYKCCEFQCLHLDIQALLMKNFVQQLVEVVMLDITREQATHCLLRCIEATTKVHGQSKYRMHDRVIGASKHVLRVLGTVPKLICL